MDIAILLLIYAQLILGLSSIFASAQHLDGSEMLVLAEWAQRIVTLRGGAADLIAGVDPIFKLHIVLGMTIFLVFPFSRLVLTRYGQGGRTERSGRWSCRGRCAA